MEIIILLIAYAFIVVSELLPLIKEKNKKEIWVYASLLTISFIILLLFILGIEVPSPTTLIKTLVKIFTG